jgi:hypothetical protein
LLQVVKLVVTPEGMRYDAVELAAWMAWMVVV